MKRFMMLDQLVIHESREASDPHWDMRLDIDDMSYEVRDQLPNTSKQHQNVYLTKVTFYVVVCRNSWHWKRE
jgi:hypothetical protein